MRAITDLEIIFLVWIQENIRKDGLSTVMIWITKLGDMGAFWIILALLTFSNKKTRKIGYAAILSIVACTLINNIALKNIVARTRPYDYSDQIIPLVKRLKDYSFPSGHTSISFASAFTYYKLCDRKYGVSLMVLAGLIALSRLYVSVHYPSDVLGGVITGFLSSYVALKYIDFRDKKKNN